MRDGRLKEQPPRPGFLPPFGRRHSLLGHPVPAKELGLPHGRLTGAAQHQAETRRTRTGFPCSARARHGWGLGALCTPGTAVSTRPRNVHDRRLPHRNGIVPTRPALLPDPDGLGDEASPRVPIKSPHASLPLTCGPRTVQEPLGFPVSFAPSRYRPRTSRRGRVLDTDPKSRRRHRPTSNRRTHLPRATSRRNGSSSRPSAGPGPGCATPTRPTGGPG
jgi:hypothetical protein